MALKDDSLAGQICYRRVTVSAKRKSPVKILGIVSETHDAGVALLEDGVPVLVLEEERLNRQKHTRDFPNLALEEAFDAEGRNFAACARDC